MNKEILVLKISDLVKPTIEAMGYELWGCELVNAVGRCTIRIYIDSPTGINLDDCRKISHQISAIFDVEDSGLGVLQGRQYDLEVSSPGMDRYLFSEEQYKKFINNEVRIKLSILMNGRRTYVGKIAEVIAGNVGIITDEGKVTIPIKDIEKAKIIPQY